MFTFSSLARRALSRPRTFFKPHPRTADPHNRLRTRDVSVSTEPFFSEEEAGPVVMTLNGGDKVRMDDLHASLREHFNWEDPNAYVSCIFFFSFFLRWL